MQKNWIGFWIWGIPEAMDSVVIADCAQTHAHMHVLYVCWCFEFAQHLKNYRKINSSAQGTCGRYAPTATAAGAPGLAAQTGRAGQAAGGRRAGTASELLELADHRELAERLPELP